jgi:hypothetical protein
MIKIHRLRKLKEREEVFLPVLKNHDYLLIILIARIITS